MNGYSEDLRRRVVSAVEGGMSKSQAGLTAGTPPPPLSFSAQLPSCSLPRLPSGRPSPYVAIPNSLANPDQRSLKGCPGGPGGDAKEAIVLRRGGLPPDNHPRPVGASPEPSSRRAYRVGPPNLSVAYYGGPPRGSGRTGLEPERPVPRPDELRPELFRRSTSGPRA